MSRGVASNAVKHLLEGGGSDGVDGRTRDVLDELGAAEVPRPVLVAVLLAYAREKPGQLPRASRILNFLEDPADRDAALTYALGIGVHPSPTAPRDVDFVHQWSD